jgi:hypothetical protein
MTFNISLPTAEDMTTLPIIDITPDGIWVPSEFNDNHSLQFDDPPILAQTVQTHDFSDFHDCFDTTAAETPDPETFHDATDELFVSDGGHYFDPSDSTLHTPVARVFHLSIDGGTSLNSTAIDHFLMNLSLEELEGRTEVFDSFAYASRAAIQDQSQHYVEYLGYRPVDIIRKTLENTSQLAHTILRFPMRRHVKARFPWLNCNRLREAVATDTYFANVHAIGGATCAQVFYGIKSHMINVIGMKTEGEMPEAYTDFI